MAKSTGKTTNSSDEALKKGAAAEAVEHLLAAEAAIDYLVAHEAGIQSQLLKQWLGQVKFVERSMQAGYSVRIEAA